MNVIIFDTETTSLDKPFCYDVGYMIYNTDTQEVQKEAHYVIEQTWHNLPLFESAYYKEKRPLYIQLMRSKKAVLNKWGYVMRAMYRDIKEYEITDGYAYNSDFDDKVFTFNCDWFKCNNPLETVAIHDIWGYASQFITNTNNYRDFCEQQQLFTDTGNYKGSAEAVYRYITNLTDFEEAHMGLMDVEIEAYILQECINRGAEWNHDYKVNRTIKREQEKPFTVKINGEVMYQGEYIKKYIRNDCYNFTTRD